MALTHTLCHRSLHECASSQACFWDGDKLEQRKSFSQDWKVESASFCPARGRFVVGGEDMYAHLYEYATGNELECNRGAQPAQHSALAAQCECAKVLSRIVGLWGQRTSFGMQGTDPSGHPG